MKQDDIMDNLSDLLGNSLKLIIKIDLTVYLIVE